MGGVKANKENEQKKKAVINHIVANKEMRVNLLIMDFLLKFISD